jgi:hypothetical protein
MSCAECRLRHGFEAAYRAQGIHGAKTHRGKDKHARQRSAPGIPMRELARSTVGRDKGLCAAAFDAFINAAFKVRAFLFGARMPHRRPTIDASRSFDLAVQSHPSLCCQRHCCLLPGTCIMKQAAIGRPRQSKIPRPCGWRQICCRWETDPIARNLDLLARPVDPLHPVAAVFHAGVVGRLKSGENAIEIPQIFRHFGLLGRGRGSRARHLFRAIARRGIARESRCTGVE